MFVFLVERTIFSLATAGIIKYYIKITSEVSCKITVNNFPLVDTSLNKCKLITINKVYIWQDLLEVYKKKLIVFHDIFSTFPDNIVLKRVMYIYKKFQIKKK